MFLPRDSSMNSRRDLELCRSGMEGLDCIVIVERNSVSITSWFGKASLDGG